MACVNCYNEKATSGTSIHLKSPKECCLRMKLLTVRRKPNKNIVGSIATAIESYREINSSTVAINVFEMQEGKVWTALQSNPDVLSISDSDWTTVSESGLPQNGIPLIKSGQGRTTEEIKSSAIVFGFCVVVLAAVVLVAFLGVLKW